MSKTKTPPVGKQMEAIFRRLPKAKKRLLRKAALEDRLTLCGDIGHLYALPDGSV